MAETKRFSVGAVLSVGTGRLASSMGEVYDVLNWMLDDNLMTHQLPAASRAVEGDLEQQFPWLAEVTLPEGGGEAFTAAVHALTAEHGPLVDVARATDPAWKRGNALRDLLDIADGRPVVIVKVPKIEEGDRG